MSQQSETNLKLNNNRKAFIDIDSICKSFFRQLLHKTYQGVGLQNAKKMAPKNTNLQTLHVLKSFVTTAFTQKYNKSQKLIDQKDPPPAQIDNLAVQEIDSQKSKIKQLPEIPQQSSTTKSRLNHKKQRTQISVRSRKFTSIDENQQQKKSKLLANFEKLQEQKNQFDFTDDPQLNKIRVNFLKIQNQNHQREQQQQKIRQKGFIDRQKSEKIVKQMKKITYDYEGKLFGQGNGISQPQKLTNLQNKFGNIKKNMLKSTKLQNTTIQSNKKKDQKSQRKDFKQAPMFRQEAQSIIQNIQLNKGISAGVKITQQLGQNKSVTKENPLKKPAIHSLADFKQNSKQSRFKQYHPVSLNKDKSYLNFTSINNQQTTRSRADILADSRHKNKAFKSLSTYSLNQGHKHKTLQLLEQYGSTRGNNDSILDGITFQQKKKIKAKVQYRGLPFIKTKGYKAIDFTSQKSFKMVSDEKIDNKKNKYRNKISINDISLLKVTLQNL